MMKIDYEKLQKSTANIFFLFPSVFYYYLKGNWNGMKANVLPKYKYSPVNKNYICEY